jgi:beta-glucosidase/6-phospho-beta-glucosidase/beta-galactosidase
VLGLYELLKSIKAKWDKPIFLITENGVADKSDKLRAPLIVSHLKELKKNSEYKEYWQFAGENAQSSAI